MLHRTLPFLLLLLAFAAPAQKMKMTALKPVMVKATVVGVLEGNSQLAVIYITDVDSTNEHGLQNDTEILTRFYFGTAPTKGDPKLTGTKKGDVIRAEVAGQHDSTSGQMNYTVFKYTVLPPGTTESPSAEGGDPPRK